MEPATRFADAIKGMGVDVEVQTYAGGHGPRSPSVELAVLQQNLDWFVRNVRDLEKAH